MGRGMREHHCLHVFAVLLVYVDPAGREFAQGTGMINSIVGPSTDKDGLVELSDFMNPLQGGRNNTLKHLPGLSPHYSCSLWS